MIKNIAKPTNPPPFKKIIGARILVGSGAAAARCGLTLIPCDEKGTMPSGSKQEDQLLTISAKSWAQIEAVLEAELAASSGA
jgi:hypothetical protein